jgi:hypothetical protein
MNERIKELEIQSVFYNEDTQSWEFDREKFAELIVRECAELLKKESEEYYIVGSDYCEHSKAEAFNEAVDLVKQHFGVE